MANIGTFTQTQDGSFTGAIHTLTLNVESAQFRPIEKTRDGQPDYRVMAGKAELGAAWKATTQDGRDYINVKLDDPSLPKYIKAVLVQGDEGHNLIWSREQPAPKKSRRSAKKAS